MGDPIHNGWLNLRLREGAAWLALWCGDGRFALGFCARHRSRQTDGPRQWHL